MVGWPFPAKCSSDNEGWKLSWAAFPLLLCAGLSDKLRALFFGLSNQLQFFSLQAGGQTHFPVPPKGHSERANELGSSNNPRQGVRDLPPLNTHGKQIAWHHLHSPHQIYSKSKHPFPSSWFSFNCAEHNPNLPQERWSVCIFLFLLFYK